MFVSTLPPDSPVYYLSISPSLSHPLCIPVTSQPDFSGHFVCLFIKQKSVEHIARSPCLPFSPCLSLYLSPSLSVSTCLLPYPVSTCLYSHFYCTSTETSEKYIFLIYQWHQLKDQFYIAQFIVKTYACFQLVSLRHYRYILILPCQLLFTKQSIKVNFSKAFNYFLFFFLSTWRALSCSLPRELSQCMSHSTFYYNTYDITISRHLCIYYIYICIYLLRYVFTYVFRNEHYVYGTQ